MKVIKYMMEIPAVIEKGPDGVERIVHEAFLREYRLSFTEANKSDQIAEAVRRSYNGEYTIEDDGKPEPIIPPTNEELAAENKLLKQQVSALTDQQSFYEDCIAEMATVVYA